jgi:hypothetical protein
MITRITTTTATAIIMFLFLSTPSNAKTTFALAGYDEEQLLRHVTAVKGEGLLAGRHNVHGATQATESDERPGAAPFDGELFAVTAARRRY